MHEVFVWPSLIWSGVNHHNIHMIYATVVLALFTVLAIAVRPKLLAIEGRLIPEGKGSAANIMEVAVEQILSLLEGIIGPTAHKYFPLFGALFLYIFICNVMSLIPGFLPPTDNVNTNLACAVTVMVYYNYIGFKENGFGYIKHMMGPIWWLAPLMLAIEALGYLLVRPASLTMRLLGNITGDHMVLGIFSDLVPLVIPVIFLGLGLFVAFIQAFVFTLLSVIYVAMSTAGDEEGH
jgi:F-type H+-transporting ATPase subunit a